MQRISVVVHPTCASSYEVVKGLAARGLLDKVELLDARSPSVVFEYRVWSVPWVLVDRDPVATDPVGVDEIVAIASGTYRPGERSVKDVEEALIHSSFAAAVAVLNDDPRPALSRELVAAALRARFSRLDVDAVLVESLRVFSEGWEEVREKLARALGVSFVRELWWSREGRLQPEDVQRVVEKGAVRLWLLGKASIGRGGLPWRPNSMPPGVEVIERFVSRAARGLLRKVETEQRRILEDDEYWQILEKHLVS